MKLIDLETGQTFAHPLKGDCTISNVTKRTLEYVHKYGKTKVTFKSSTEDFLIVDL